MRPRSSVPLDGIDTTQPVTRMPTGFPSPAEDHAEAGLDLHEYLVRHPAATFFMEMEGEAMRDAGIFPHDILVVDRSLDPMPGAVVVAVVDGEFVVRRYAPAGGRLWLTADNPDVAPIPIWELTDYTIWGVVTFVIHHVSRRPPDSSCADPI